MESIQILEGDAYIREPERKTRVVANVDILVCGGGFAGFAAAYSAARMGLKVLLIEKYGFLGGLVTSSLVITTPPLDNGINLEIVEQLKARKVYVPSKDMGPDFEVVDMEIFAVDPEVVKYSFVNMLLDKKVELLLHTYVVESIMEENRIRGVIVETKSGRMAVMAKVVVDTTGDADLVMFSGAPFCEVKQPMTMMYNLVQVDVEKALDYLGNWGRIRKIVKQAIDDRELNFELGIFPAFGAPGVHAAKLVYPGQLNVWSGMLDGMSGVDPWDLTQAEIITRDHVMRLTDFMKSRIPGFEQCRIEMTSTQVGVRASRQLIGEASPTWNDIKTAKFDDVVAKPYAIKSMTLPYGTILPQNIDNLLVAGRCVSAEEEAMGMLRLWPVCSITGQAAGVAAALSIQEETTPRELDVRLLQRSLRDQGMDLE